MALQSLALTPVSREARIPGSDPHGPTKARIYPLTRARPKVLFATSEFADFIQAGGLGAVSASLPRALAASSDIRVLLPGYPSVLEKAQRLEIVEQLPPEAGMPSCTLALATLPDGLSLYVALCDELYRRAGSPYADAEGIAHSDNDVRFARLSLAAAEIAARAVGGWRPDVVHLNDWGTALTAGYLAWRGVDTPSVLTIHNLAHQGQFPAARLGVLGIPEQAFGIDGVEFYGRISFLKAGIACASRVTTVSETYAREILTAEFGCGLEGLLAKRAAEGKLSGVINGVDRDWDPRKDRNCPYMFDPQRWKSRYADFVRGAFGLSLARAPLFAFIARFAHQKGVDLVIDAARRIVDLGGQFVAIGEGESDAELALRELAHSHPDAVGVRIGFDPGQARTLFAGSDFLLMPSRFEPCGLSQMYAQRFGSLPIAHRTGGVGETVFDGKTGLLFDRADAPSLEGALRRAFDLYKQPREFSAMRRAAMALDFDWERSAKRYLEIYRELCRGT
jgi:starch synthase